MTLFDRVARLLRANLNDLVARVEDPEKVLEQALLDMKAAYREARRAVAEAMAEKTRLGREVRAYREMAEGFRSRAREALAAGREDLAREALREAVRAETLAAELGRQLEEQEAATRRLREQLAALSAKIAEAEGRRRVLLARKRTYRAARAVRTLDDRVLGHPATQAFEAMAERIEAMGDRERALSALAAEEEPQAALSAWEEARAVEAELEALRKEVAG